MKKKSWHERLLTTEACFHVLAIAFVVRALFGAPENSTVWLAAAGSSYAMGRSLPTEKVDEALSIPLVKNEKIDG